MSISPCLLSLYYTIKCLEVRLYMSNKGKLRNFGVYCEILELRFSELIVQSSPVLASPWVTQV